MSLRTKFWLIIALTLVAAILAYPREDLILSKLGLKNAKLHVQQGLDLQGGAHLGFQADLSKTPSQDRTQAMSSLIDVIQRRVNPSGTSEVGVQRLGSDRVIVELPGVTDIDQAISLIGQSGELSFLEIPSATSQSPVATGITGKDVSRADPDFDTQTGQPVVRLQMKGESTGKFGDLTTKIHNENGYLLTLLDGQPVFGPATVNQPITDGNAQLSGNFKTVADARKVANLINGGALPVPIHLVEERSVGPTLGKESIQKSLVAGIVGLLVVALFMIAYYRLVGALAVGALAIYALLTLAIYKLSVFTPIPITLTLAGIAGFILSIGMAVDANILIFERLKEELRAGKTLVAAVEAGFDRAWTSIRDSNVSTLITCFILYAFSGASPIIKGFAVTLGLGVLVSMFTAVVISRTLLRLLIRQGWSRRASAYGLTTTEVQL